MQIREKERVAMRTGSPTAAAKMMERVLRGMRRRRRGWCWGGESVMVDCLAVEYAVRELIVSAVLYVDCCRCRDMLLVRGVCSKHLPVGKPGQPGY